MWRKVTVAAVVFLLASHVVGKEAPQEKKPLTVAVLEFSAGTEEAKAIAKSLPDLLEASLATVKQLRLVTRRELDRIQKEQSLDLAGLVAMGQGAKVGRLVGADVLVIGRATIVDDELILLAKAIGVETSVILPVVVRGPFQAKAAALAEELSKKLASVLEERSGEVLAPSDPMSEEEKLLGKELGKLETPLPTVGVTIFEDHLSARRGVDPAAETEILAVFRRLGFTLHELSGQNVRDWLLRFQRGEVTFGGKSPLDVEVVIVGRAFSEFGGRVGELVSAKARLEARAIRVKDGRILEVYRGSNAAADLSEIFAGKKALQELGRAAALKLARPVAKAGEER